MGLFYDGRVPAAANIPRKINSDNTPYDDAFKTLLIDCTRLIIPVIKKNGFQLHDCWKSDEKISY